MRMGRYRGAPLAGTHLEQGVGNASQERVVRGTRWQGGCVPPLCGLSPQCLRGGRRRRHAGLCGQELLPEWREVRRMQGVRVHVQRRTVHQSRGHGQPRLSVRSRGENDV